MLGLPSSTFASGVPTTTHVHVTNPISDIYFCKATELLGKLIRKQRGMKACGRVEVYLRALVTSPLGLAWYRQLLRPSSPDGVLAI
jgi:hypothetical protein